MCVRVCCILIMVKSGAFQPEEVEQGLFYRTNPLPTTKLHERINLNNSKYAKSVILNKSTFKFMIEMFQQDCKFNMRLGNKNVLLMELTQSTTLKT